MHSRAMRRSVFVLLAALSPVACSDSSGPEGQSRVTVHLTDTPGDVEAAVVTISEVYLQGSEGRVTLSDDEVTVDLLDLANSTAVIVDEAVVPEGNYSELRFVITGAYVEVENGSGGTDIYASSPSYSGLPAGATVTGDLQMPSLGQSGLKVEIVDGDLDVTEDEDILVDFDVSQSFGHLAGQSGKWVMHPVVKGAVFTQAASLTTTLVLAQGVTLPVVGGSAVTLGLFKAELEGEQVTFTDADNNGTFEAQFRFLLPGTYTLKIIAPTGVTITTNPASPIEVTIGTGATATQAVTIASASAG
jgi:hypothetical protein